MEEVRKLSTERQAFESEQRDGILVELSHEKKLTQELTM